MDTHVHSQSDSRVTQPWNKGKLTGAKPPLRPKHVWAVRTRLHLLRRFRDLALFNLAIDSKLRGCDLVGLKLLTWRPMVSRRSSLRSTTQNRKARSLRDDGANAPSDRRLYLATAWNIWSIRLPWTRSSRASQHATVRKTISGVAGNDRP